MGEQKSGAGNVRPAGVKRDSGPEMIEYREVRRAMTIRKVSRKSAVTCKCCGSC
jgi:hypothetical protein